MFIHSVLSPESIVNLLTNKEYSKIKDLLPTGKLRDKSLPDNMLFIEAVLYVAKVGCGWRQLPMKYGKWKSTW
jgi:transposase